MLSFISLVDDLCDQNVISGFKQKQNKQALPAVLLHVISLQAVFSWIYDKKLFLLRLSTRQKASKSSVTLWTSLFLGESSVTVVAKTIGSSAQVSKAVLLGVSVKREKQRMGFF